MRPSLVDAAIKTLSLNSKITGDDANGCPALYIALSFRVFASSVASSPPVVATYNVPSGPKAAPAEPATWPESGFHVNASLVERSTAMIDSATLPQREATAA